MSVHDRQNLIRGWPVYAVCLLLIMAMFLLWKRNLSLHGNEPLRKSIAKNLLGKDSKALLSLDEIINDRKTWEPALPDWQNKTLPDLTFQDPRGQSRSLKETIGSNRILLLGETWYPPFRIQLLELKELSNALPEKTLRIIPLSTESAQTLDSFSRQNGLSFTFGTITALPEPFSLPDGFPCLFFIDPEGRLKLAAVGLVPARHAQAILDL